MYIKYEKRGKYEIAEGIGWRFERRGDDSIFKQTGKVGSLRKVKELLKIVRTISLRGDTK